MNATKTCLRHRTYLAVVLYASLSAPAAAEPLPPGFIHLRDIDSSIREEMHYAGPDNFTGRPLPGYDAGECLLRRPVALALKQVQADLTKAGYSLKVYDCYRPTRAVAAMAAWARNAQAMPDTSRFYPGLDKSKLFALGYISGHSAHSRGVAIDLTVVPLKGAPVAAFDPAKRYGPCTAPAADRAPDDSLDMGAGFDCFSVKSWTASGSITPAQKANRRVLWEAMHRHGFTNYKREWWHFSYGRADDGVAFDTPIRRR